MEPHQFVAKVRPLLAANDLPGLLAFLKSRFTPEQIVGFLSSDDADAQKVAALALALVGGRCCVKPLIEQLKSPDPVVNAMAEHALWSIWLRSGSADANHHVSRGVSAIERRDFHHAVDHFHQAIQIDPAFAEAYNQRAIAHFLLENYAESARDCRRAIERMPSHFGAWAGLGHCYAELGRFGDAAKCYRKATAINPHLSGVCEALSSLNEHVDDPCAETWMS